MVGEASGSPRRSTRSLLRRYQCQQTCKTLFWGNLSNYIIKSQGNWLIRCWCLFIVSYTPFWSKSCQLWANTPRLWESIHCFWYSLVSPYLLLFGHKLMIFLVLSVSLGPPCSCTQWLAFSLRCLRVQINSKRNYKTTHNLKRPTFSDFSKCFYWHFNAITQSAWGDVMLAAGIWLFLQTCVFVCVCVFKCPVRRA